MHKRSHLHSRSLRDVSVVVGRSRRGRLKHHPSTYKPCRRHGHDFADSRPACTCMAIAQSHGTWKEGAPSLKENRKPLRNGDTHQLAQPSHERLSVDIDEALGETRWPGP